MPNLPNFPIPSVINPDKTRCLCIKVPDNDDWVQIIVGLLAMPTYWFNWQRTGDTSGSQSAKVWTDLFNQIDWGTMSCCCPDNPSSFIIQLLNQQVALQLQQMDTGTVSSYAPNAPNTTFHSDSRDTTTAEQDATKATLCHACDQYVRQVLADNLSAAAVAAAVSADIAVLTGLLNPIAGAIVVLLGSLPYASWLGIANDMDAINDVVCKLYGYLYSLSPTFDHFKGFASISPSWVNSNAATLGDAVQLAVSNEQNFRAFMVYLQIKVDGTTNPCDDCPVLGCSTADWVAEAGTIDSGTRTSTYVEIDAINGGDGHYYLQFISTSPDECCTFDVSSGGASDIQVVSGSPNLSFYSACGDPLSTWQALGFVVVDANGIFYRGDGPFRLSFDTGDSPP